MFFPFGGYTIFSFPVRKACRRECSLPSAVIYTFLSWFPSWIPLKTCYLSLGFSGVWDIKQFSDFNFQIFSFSLLFQLVFSELRCSTMSTVFYMYTYHQLTYITQIHPNLLAPLCLKTGTAFNNNIQYPVALVLFFCVFFCYVLFCFCFFYRIENHLRLH